MRHTIAMLTRAAALAILAGMALTVAPATATTTGFGCPSWGAIGDSITYGLGVPRTHYGWAARAGLPHEGRPGQNLITPGPQPTLVESFPAELATLRAQHVNAVAVEIGINDLGWQPTDQAMIDGYRQVESDAAAQGVRVMLATITPWAPGRPGVTPEMRAQRDRLNAWIRTQPHIDFAWAVGRGTGTLRPRFDSGDHLHPDARGASALAYTFDNQARAWSCWEVRN